MNAINNAATALLINKRWPGVPLSPDLISLQLVEVPWVVFDLLGIQVTTTEPQVHALYLRQSASAIKAPTLLLFGKYDPVISAKKDGAVTARSVRGAQLAVMKSGHAPFARVPETFLAETLPFLAR